MGTVFAFHFLHRSRIVANQVIIAGDHTMSHEAQNYFSPSDVLRILQDRPRRWIIPTLAFTLLACVYAVVRNSTWEASQALIIREEANPEQQRRPGSFVDVNEMKTVQETILELVRSKSVLRNSLAAIGPAKGETVKKGWPTDRDIADLRERIKMTPPNGAEFGKTEVFYLKVRDKDRARAVLMAEEICRQLQHGFQSLRDTKMQSVTDELARAVKMAESDLSVATKQLGGLESKVGVDLAELRMLHVGTTSGSDLRQKLVEIQNEIRVNEADLARHGQLLLVLKSAQKDPGRLLATPNTLLAALPSVNRLKNGLVDAQLATSQLIGTMSLDHPLVRSAKSAEAEISLSLHDEMAVAIKGLEIEKKLTNARLETLRRQLAHDEGRLQRLASLRAEYANLVAMTENRTSLLEAARRNLADARAGRASVNNINLISRIDTPDTGINPIGPSKTVIAGAGMLGGLLVGLGYVFLTTGPLPPNSANAAAMSETYQDDYSDDYQNEPMYPVASYEPGYAREYQAAYEPSYASHAVASTNNVEESLELSESNAIAENRAETEDAATTPDGLSFTGALKKLSRQHFSVVGENIA
jgi:uncharacterized protein involved in exopolysaccharide biosynthesis